MVDLSPRRRLAAPFFATLSPLAWVVYRGGPGLEWASPEPGPMLVPLLFGAALVSYAVAVVVAPRLPELSGLPVPLRPLLAPSNTTLAVVADASVAVGVYVFAAISLPSPLDTVASVVGVLLGWPALLAVLASIVLGNVFAPGGLGYGVEFAIVALGVSLSALWLFVLAGGVVRLVGGDATA
jgi:hypothetical protein